MTVLTKKIESIITASKLIPMWGKAPHFPWDDFRQKLTASLELTDLNLTPDKAGWREHDDLLSGMGSEPATLAINLTPINDPLFLALPKEDLNRLSRWMLGDETFTDRDLQKGFFEFAALHALASTDQLAVFHQLSPKVADAPFTKSKSYTVDVALTHKEETIWCRLILPEPFHKELITHYATHTPPLQGSPIAEATDVTISLIAGHVFLDQDDFKDLEVGDFVLLDKNTYHPLTEKGMLQLNLENAPLFQVKLKDGELKVLDFAVILEDNPMNENEELAQHQDEMMSEQGDESVAQNAELTAIENVPLQVVVEAARMQMNLEKLLSLKPGNILECGVEKNARVNLTVGGKVVARGELIELGDVVGVKIEEIG